MRPRVPCERCAKPFVPFGRRNGRRFCSVDCRFLSHVQLSSGNSCWTWNGDLDRHGYGRFFAAEFKTRSAHRIGYMLLVGPIPDGLTLDHLCRNTRCVNPDHLEPVTQRVNNARSMSPSAQHACKTHCDTGHEFTPENTYTYVRGGRRVRSCRTCNRAAVARLHARRRETAS